MAVPVAVLHKNKLLLAEGGLILWNTYLVHHLFRFIIETILIHIFWTAVVSQKCYWLTSNKTGRVIMFMGMEANTAKELPVSQWKENLYQHEIGNKACAYVCSFQ